MAVPFDQSARRHDALGVSDVKARPTLLALAVVVTRDSNLTFGGGTVTSEVLRRSLIKREWIDDADHRALYALSRLTPGTNLLAYCTGVGWITRGLAGASVTWLASSVPAALLSLAARSAYVALSASQSLAVVVLLGMTVAVVLLGSSAWHLAKPFIKVGGSWWVAIVTLAVVLTVIGFAPIQVLLVAALVGLLRPQR